MRVSIASAAIAALTFAATSQSLNILMNNDDGFASINLRQFYDMLKAEGHDVLIVAPAVDNSGQAGRSSFSTSSTLEAPSEYGIVAAGAPSLGQDPTDANVWYYNGTPAACTFVALDYVIPRYWDNRTVDLFVSGPNFGDNLGPFLYTLAGTLGATYAAIGRGLPGIAFSGGNSGQRSYQWLNATTASGYPDPATITAQLAVEVVNQLINKTKTGDRLLPLGYGINVNNPIISSFTNASCVKPPFVQTRLTGGAFTDGAAYNATSGLFTYTNYLGAGVNTCINGNCSLPGETNVVDDGCFSSVSVFTVDYDAPVGAAQHSVRSRLQPLVDFQSGSEGGKKLTAREAEARHPLRHE